MILSNISSKRMVSFVVSLALFMEALDVSIINTAIPAMARSLHVNPVDLKIALISYLLSLAVFIPISGWVADKYGVKRVFIIALIIFTLSSFWCGFVSALWELTVARTIQGLGGSMMMPIGRLILLQTFKRHQLVSVMNQVIMVGALGSMLGPLAGGFITDHLSWPWIFWINIPIGLCTILMAKYWFTESKLKIVKRLDLVGFILFGGGLASFTFALSDLSESTASIYQAFYIMALSILMLIGYFLHSRRQQNPLVNTKLFRYRTFTVSMISNLISRLGFGGVPFLLPLLLQVPLNYSAQLAGLLISPLALGVVVAKPVSLRLYRLFGFKNLLFINTILVALALWSFIIINEQTSFLIITILVLIFGFLVSVQYGGMNSISYAEVKADELSSATSIISTMQQISQSFGVATSALLLRIYSHSATTTHLILTSKLFHQTFFTLGLITLISCLIFLRLKDEDGHQMLRAPAQNKVTVS